MKSLSHLVDNFLLRLGNATARVDSVRHFDDRFTAASEKCRKFAFIECGPGQLCSRHYFTRTSETLASLAYTRLSENWSECVTQTVSSDFAVLIVYHHDINEVATAVVRKYRSKTPLTFVETSEIFFYEVSDLEEGYSLVPIDELLATRVVVLTGSLEKSVLSLMREGFEHN